MDDIRKNILNKIQIEKMIEIEDMMIILDISYPTARKYLKTLTLKKKVKPVRVGKKVKYFILEKFDESKGVDIYDFLGKNL